MLVLLSLYTEMLDYACTAQFVHCEMLDYACSAQFVHCKLCLHCSVFFFITEIDFSNGRFTLKIKPYSLFDFAHFLGPETVC